MNGPLTSAGKRRAFRTLFFFAVFAFFFAWFCFLHPAVLYDADDWRYIAQPRLPVPLWGAWNPTRVLPEVLMPFCGRIAASVVFPLTGDYLHAVTLVSACVISLFCTWYFSAFFGLCEKRSPGGMTPYMQTLLFAVLHFAFFRSGKAERIHLFYCSDLCCCYFYLIPSLMNAALAFTFASGRKIKPLILVPLIYFAVFSNLPCAFILAAYFGCSFAADLMRCDSTRPAEFMRRHLLHLCVAVLWAVSAVFELSGGRAASAPVPAGSFFQSLKRSAFFLLRRFCRTDPAVLFVALFALVAAAIVRFRGRRTVSDAGHGSGFPLLPAMQTAVHAAFLLLLTAKVDPAFAERPEYLFPLASTLLGTAVLSLGSTVGKTACGKYVLPLLLVPVLFSAVIGRPFKDPNTSNLSAPEAYAVGNAILSEVMIAAQTETEPFEILVPVSGKKKDNWPFPDYFGGILSETAYRHGFTKRRMAFTAVPSAAFSELPAVRP